MSGKTRKVRALRTGFYGSHRHKPGTLFEVAASATGTWFEDADTPPEKSKATRQKKEPEYRKAQAKKRAKVAKVIETQDPDAVEDLV